MSDNIGASIAANEGRLKVLRTDRSQRLNFHNRIPAASAYLRQFAQRAPVPRKCVPMVRICNRSSFSRRGHVKSRCGSLSERQYCQELASTNSKPYRHCFKFNAVGVMMKPAAQAIFCPLDKTDSTAVLERNSSQRFLSRSRKWAMRLNAHPRLCSAQDFIDVTAARW
jgi:hypothetical protein